MYGKQTETINQNANYSSIGFISKITIHLYLRLKIHLVPDNHPNFYVQVDNSHWVLSLRKQVLNVVIKFQMYKFSYYQSRCGLY